MNDESKEKDLERPHVVDGIKEYDNPLPSWWVGLFIFTIIFGCGYMAYYHFGSGSSLEENLHADLSQSQKATETAEQVVHSDKGPNQTKPPSQNETDDLAAKVGEQAVINAGKAHYDTYCSPCHLPDLGGQIGPNLVDEYWLHGCTPKEIVKVIETGVVEKGMAAWGPILGKKKIIEEIGRAHV